MKKIFTIACAALCLVACTKDPGSVSGNVYYKYNNFVGNKPDAGASIKLFKADEAAKGPNYETTTDVQGNYKIENVIPTEYLLMIQSKNTTAKDSEIFDQLIANSKEIKEVFGADIDAIKKEIEEVNTLDVKASEAYSNAMSDLSASGKKYVTEYGSILKLRNEKVKAILAKLPADLQKHLGLANGVGQKIELKKLTVNEAQNSQNNTDFGLTYN